MGKLQGIWDKCHTTHKLNLVASGSVNRMMNKILFCYSEPLYGRNTAHLQLRPFPVSLLKKIFKAYAPGYGKRDLLDLWTITGGVDGGVSVSVEGVKGGTAWFPEGVMLNGTHDWMRQEYEFETTKKDLASAISLRLRFCRGTAWFDEIRLEEVGPTEEGLKRQKELEKKEAPDKLTLDEE